MSSIGNMLKKPENMPSAPGVYVFRDRSKNALYIGKAVNLKRRLSSYWRKNTGVKVSQLIGEAVKVEWITAESEIDALLKEAEIIKQHKPKFNILMRDDKDYFYVGITKEKFPRIFLTHQPKKLQATSYKLQAKFIGPFTSGVSLKIVLKLMRRIFPHCTCKKPHKRLCLNAQIGRCPGFCCLKSSLQHSHILKNVRMLADAEQAYRKNVQNIIAVLNGRKKRIFQELKRAMGKSVQRQEFERAATLRDQMLGLENIFSHPVSPALQARRPSWPRIERVIRAIVGAKKRISRIEGYDISNISGTAATGSMVVFVDGAPAKAEYRKFKIKTVQQISDVDMLKEVIGRRLIHKEWSYPDLMLIDGGRPQLNVARKVLDRIEQYYSSSGVERIPKVVALAKREEELYIEGHSSPVPLRTLPSETAFFLQQVRDESHRFAKKYHHKLREKQL